jgi:Ni/Co efflux regulator RcnB
MLMNKTMISGALILAALMAVPAVADAQTRWGDGADDQAAAERAEVRVWRIWARDRGRAHRSWEREQHRDFRAWQVSQRQQFRAFHDQERTGALLDHDLDGYFIDDPNRYNSAPPPRISFDRER